MQNFNFNAQSEYCLSIWCVFPEKDIQYWTRRTWAKIIFQEVWCIIPITVATNHCFKKWWKINQHQKQWNYEGEKHCLKQRLTSIDFRFNRKFCEIILIFYPKKTFAFYQTFTHAQIKLCTKVEAKKVLQAVQIFGSDIKPTNGNWRFLNIVEFQWKHVMTYSFAAKSYTKSQFNEVKRTFKVKISLYPL